MTEFDDQHPVEDSAGQTVDDDDIDDGACDDIDDDTEFATIAGAGTIEDAKRKALDQLRKVVPFVNEADVDFLVVDEGSRGGLFGRGKLEARVEARLRPVAERVDGDLLPDAEVLREFVQTVVDLMGIDASIDASENADRVKANISGDDLGLLIGRHGATIDALQYIAAIVVNGDRRERRQVVVDAEGYRERREVALQSLADRTAQKVARESASVTLQPMTAAERKVIHLHLKEHPRVETVSEGNEPYRAVVISPSRPVD
jgi:spoIIIJ-associated protein